MHKTILSAAAVVAAAAATLAAPASAGTTKPQVLGTVTSQGDTATMRIRYACDAGDHVWVSAKQVEGGRKDARLAQEGSGAIADAWLHSHRNAVTCDGTTRTATFTIDTLEWGQGPLERGHAWVQFCVTDSATGRLVIDERGWITVRRA